MEMRKRTGNGSGLVAADGRVRVARSASVYRCEVLGSIDNYADYHELMEVLETASANDSIILEIGSPGGDFDIASLIIRAVQNSKADVFAEIVLPSDSMAALLAVCCVDLRMNEGTYLMFHAYSTGFNGKADEFIQYANHNHRQSKRMMDKWSSPFLTQEEIESLWQGKDIYIHDDDPTLQERIKRHFVTTD